MVNNAGISGSFRRLMDDDLRDFDRVIAVDLYGVMVGTQRAARAMGEGGSIINITSIAGISPGIGFSTYRAAKAGVIHFSRCAAVEVAELGVRVNVIAPGNIATDINASFDTASIVRRIQPLQRLGGTRDVANTAVYLASERSAQVTGIVIPVDGGTTAGPPPINYDDIQAPRPLAGQRIFDMADQTVTVLRAKGVLDVDSGEVLEGASVVIEGNRITSVTDDPTAASGADQVIELPDLTLVPGLMDMEVDLVLGGPGAGFSDPVRMDPVKMGLRAVANGQRTLRAGFTTVRNLGLFIKTGGYLVDVALADAIAAGWVEGPRVIPAGHAICPTGGHLDPSAQSGLAPGIMPMTVEEGIADGIDEVRKAVRYQIKHGAKLIKCCASGGVMTPTGPPGRAAVLHRGAGRDRRRGPPPRPAGRDALPRRHRRQRRPRRRDRLHRARDDDQRRHHPAHGRHRHLPRLHLRAHRELGHLRSAEVAPGQGREVFPKAKESLSKAIEAGVKIAVGSDAPAIWHGRNAEELDVLVKRGMTPIQAIRAATTVAAELIDTPDLGRIAPDMLADIIGVTGDPLADITTFQRVPFVMKDGTVVKHRA